MCLIQKVLWSLQDDESNVEDDWSNASTFGESESKFSIRVSTYKSLNVFAMT